MKHSKSLIIRETIVALVFFMLFNYLGWKELPGFYGITPHPFFIIILLMASRYGLFAGLFSAISCASVFSGLIYVFLHKIVYTDIIALKNVILFGLVGWLVGEIRQGIIKKMEENEAAKERLKISSEKLNEENQRIKKINIEMESRISDEVSTFSNLYETSRQLQSFDLKEIYSAILNILVQYLEVNECSVYIVKGDQLLIKETISEQDKPMGVINIAFEDNIIARAARDKKVYSIRDMLEYNKADTISSDDPVMVAPLVKADGTLIGALSIEKMPFFQITSSSTKIFSMLADWVSTDIENALYFQEVKKKNILDEVLNIYTQDYFQNRLAQEFHRAKRYFIPLSIVVLKIKGLSKMSVKRRLKILKFSAAWLNTSLRLTDIVTRYKDEIPFSMIFTTTTKEQSKVAMKRILDILDSISIGMEEENSLVEVEFGVGTCTSITETTEQLLKEAEESIGQWSRADLLKTT